MKYKDTLTKIEKLYSDNLKKHGTVSSAVGWPKPDEQDLRFEKLTSIVDISPGEPITVNDYGCGYGAHLTYLVEKCGLNISAYNGYDISSEMLEEAERQLNWFDGDLNLICQSDIETTADFTFVSGTFNVRFEATDEKWQEFIEGKLAEIAKYSSRGFSFNLLSTYVDWKADDLFYGDPLYWFDYCKRKFSKEVALLHDYPLYEWTLLVRK